MEHGEIVMEGMVATIKEAGFPVHINSRYCEFNRTTHGDCTHCESNTGCGRVTLGLSYYRKVLKLRNEGGVTEGEADHYLETMMREYVCNKTFSADDIDRKIKEIEGG
jgi:hypothetical protein